MLVRSQPEAPNHFPYLICQFSCFISSKPINVFSAVHWIGSFLRICYSLQPHQSAIGNRKSPILRWGVSDRGSTLVLQTIRKGSNPLRSTRYDAGREGSQSGLINPTATVRFRLPQPVFFKGPMLAVGVCLLSRTSRVRFPPLEPCGSSVVRYRATLPWLRSRVQIPPVAPICPCSLKERHNASNVDQYGFESCQGFHMASFEFQVSGSEFRY